MKFNPFVISRNLPLLCPTLLFSVALTGCLGLTATHVQAHSGAWGVDQRGIERCYPAHPPHHPFLAGQPVLGSQALLDTDCNFAYAWGQSRDEKWHCYLANGTTGFTLLGRPALDDQDADHLCGERNLVPIYVWAPNRRGEDQCFYTDRDGGVYSSSKPVPETRCDTYYMWGSVNFIDEGAYEGDHDGSDSTELRCYASNPDTHFPLRLLVNPQDRHSKELRNRDPLPPWEQKRCGKKPKGHSFMWAMNRSGNEKCYFATRPNRDGAQYPYLNITPVYDQYCNPRYLWDQDRRGNTHCYTAKDSGVSLKGRAPVSDDLCAPGTLGYAKQITRKITDLWEWVTGQEAQ